MKCLMRMPRTRSRRALLAAALLVPIVAYAQTEPVIFEAESGTLGANLTTGTLADATYVTTTLNGTTAPTAARIASYTVTFPAAGNYELYARYRVGPDAPNDDSWYFGQGFGVKTPENGADWALQNESNTGFTAPTATVLNGGSLSRTSTFETSPCWILKNDGPPTSPSSSLSLSGHIQSA